MKTVELADYSQETGNIGDNSCEMPSKRGHVIGELRCSFCSKSEGASGKLISGPSNRTRVYICEECVAVCADIIEDDRTANEPELTPIVSKFTIHPLGPELLEAVERWAISDLEGLPASDELNRVRKLAAEMLAGGFT